MGRLGQHLLAQHGRRPSLTARPSAHRSPRVSAHHDCAAASAGKPQVWGLGEFALHWVGI